MMRTLTVTSAFLYIVAIFHNSFKAAFSCQLPHMPYYTKSEFHQLDYQQKWLESRVTPIPSSERSTEMWSLHGRPHGDIITGGRARLCAFVRAVRDFTVI